MDKSQEYVDAVKKIEVSERRGIQHDLSNLFQSCNVGGIANGNLVVLVQELDVPGMEIAPQARRFKSFNPNVYDDYNDMIANWISSKSHKATLGVLIDALEKMGWEEAKNKIINYNWKEMKDFVQPVPEARKENPNRTFVPSPGQTVIDSYEKAQVLPVEDEADPAELLPFKADSPDAYDPNVLDWTCYMPLVINVTPMVPETSETPYNQRLENQFYKMTSKPRGLVLIINNEFKNTPDERFGCHWDEQHMGKLFHDLGFDIFVAMNVKSRQLNGLLARFKAMITERTSSIVVIVMSHGNCNQVIMADDIPVHMYGNIINKFNHDGCKEMVGKPKIFIFQACQKIPKNQMMSDDVSSRQNSYMSDTFVMSSTLPGNLSWRQPSNGSRFIYTLAKVFMQNAWKDDIVELHNEINRQLDQLQLCRGQDKQGSMSSMPGVLEKLYFNPGYFVP